MQQWLQGELQTSAVRIRPTDLHSGYGNTPYAFLSIQHWLNSVQPTSVGLNWIGEASSTEQKQMWFNDKISDHTEQQILA